MVECLRSSVPLLERGSFLRPHSDEEGAGQHPAPPPCPPAGPPPPHHLVDVTRPPARFIGHAPRSHYPHSTPPANRRSRSAAPARPLPRLTLRLLDVRPPPARALLHRQPPPGERRLPSPGGIRGPGEPRAVGVPLREHRPRRPRAVRRVGETEWAAVSSGSAFPLFQPCTEPSRQLPDCTCSVALGRCARNLITFVRAATDGTAVGLSGPSVGNTKAVAA